MGRIHPEKGLELLVNCFSKLCKEMDNIELSILGPYLGQQGGGGVSYLNKLKDIINDNNVNQKVMFIEPIFDEKKLFDTISTYDFFCYPSLAERGETFGLAVVEAMSIGLVPIVSYLDCFKDFIKPYENGFIFNHRHNAEDELIKIFKVK